MRALYTILAAIISLPAVALAEEVFTMQPNICGASSAANGILLTVIFLFPITIGAIVLGGWVGFRYKAKGVLAALAIFGGLYGTESMLPKMPAGGQTCTYDL